MISWIFLPSQTSVFYSRRAAALLSSAAKAERVSLNVSFLNLLNLFFIGMERKRRESSGIVWDKKTPTLLS